MVDNKALTESVFVRGWGDTKRMLSSVWFWAFELIAGGISLYVQNGWVTLENFFEPRGVYLLEYFLTSDDVGPPQSGQIRIDWSNGFAGLAAELVRV